MIKVLLLLRHTYTVPEGEMLPLDSALAVIIYIHLSIVVEMVCSAISLALVVEASHNETTAVINMADRIALLTGFKVLNILTTVEFNSKLRK